MGEYGVQAKNSAGTGWNAVLMADITALFGLIAAPT